MRCIAREAAVSFGKLGREGAYPVPLDRLVDTLWAGSAPADPAANVATLVSRTRRILGEDALTARGRAYGIDLRVCAVDLDEAADLLDEARRRSAASEPALAAAAARRALDLLGRSGALPEEPDDGWVVRVRREADDPRRRARHLVARSVIADDPEEAAGVAADAVSADPYDEHAVRDLMRALVAQGSLGAALAAYDDLATRLDDDLGTRPAAATAEVHLAILREQPLPGEPGVRPVDRGRPTLVGRQDELARIERSWAEAVAGTGGLVLVDGVGGIGKTRLLDAAADLAEATGALCSGAGATPPSARCSCNRASTRCVRPSLAPTRVTRRRCCVITRSRGWTCFPSSARSSESHGPHPVRRAGPQGPRRHLGATAQARLRRCRRAAVTDGGAATGAAGRG